MATDYRVYLLDEMDWGYATTSVEKQLAACLSEVGVELALHPAHGLIIFEVRRHPETTLRNLEGKGIIWDACYIQRIPDAALEQFVWQIKRGGARHNNCGGTHV